MTKTTVLALLRRINFPESMVYVGTTPLPNGKYIVVLGMRGGRIQAVEAYELDDLEATLVLAMAQDATRLLEGKRGESL